jgi:hypothetical protein
VARGLLTFGSDVEVFRKELSMIKKLLCSLCLLAFACISVPARGEAPCKPVQIAEATPCVQEQLQPLREASTYNETSEVTDNADGTKTVTFVFNPKCLDDPTPCRLASRSVTAVVDCTTSTATCPQ